jgi:molecular chaperone IbpA
VLDGEDGRTILEIALAGFTNEDIEVATQQHVLNVSANKQPREKERKYQHKGISQKSFSRNWQMAEDVEVESVDFKDGLLTIVLRKELPEKQKRKKWF